MIIRLIWFIIVVVVFLFLCNLSSQTLGSSTHSLLKGYWEYLVEVGMRSMWLKCVWISSYISTALNL